MTHANSQSKFRISVSDADNDEHLMMTVTRGSECDFHQISLDEARALSLELIKQAYRAELRSHLKKPIPGQSVSPRFQHQNHTSR